MTRLFLIRHAEPVTAWGADDPDPGLSPLGRSQAQAASEALVGLGVSHIVSSPMKRCLETAAPLAVVTGLTLRLEARVSEVVAPAGVSDRRAWLRENFAWHDGAPRRVWSSVDPALRGWRAHAIAALHDMPRDSAIFSHFIAINAILSAALKHDETIVHRPAHASISEIEIEGDGLRLVRLGAEMNSDDVR